MLQDIRDKSQGIVVKVIIGVVIVTFALFGVEALVQSFTTSDTVAEVDGQEITRTQLMQTAETQRRQLISMMGGQIDPAMLEDNVLQRRALDELVQRAVLSNQAKALNLGVSDAQIDAFLVQVEQFQTNGQFDQNKYLNYIRSLAMTPLAFKERIKQDMLIQQSRNALIGSEFVLPSQIEYVSRLQNQQRSFDFVRFSLADQMEQMDVSEEALAAYYDEHQQSFVSPEQVKLNYVLISAEDLEQDIEISDAELQSAYEAYVGNFQNEEREAAHILIDTASRSDDEAQALVEQIQTELAEGADFADLAAQYSDDLGSKDNGGDLGYVTRGIMVEPFEDALFAMQEGDVETVETEFGYHIVKLNEIVATDAPSLDEVRAELMADLVPQKAQEQLLAEHENITDLAYASDDLDALADEYNTSVLTTDFFGRDGGSDDITTAPAVISAAYSPTVLEDGHNSDLIELSDTQVVVVNLNQHNQAAQQSFEEAKDAITEIVMQQQAAQALQQMAQAQLNSEDADWTSVNNADRGQNEVASLAFGLAYPEDGKPTLAVETMSNGDVVALRLREVTQSETQVSDAERETYENSLRQIFYRSTLQARQALLESNAEIERNN
ncbi:SurA N-terminal domain-containing protein [Marinomonas ostreistagni]|uniref:SurA N-terminal domain-containing protein n=1 Tax=Marinomonas ostreistagni TaxID=359209 RepID=UPI001950858D|nr:SurA N-terminal domain-containing protein [Marinomonas ostreistagni]MBM6551935.1 SurA N-terminal domain-containing protein [Marinomonas ostreistagni]